MILNLVLFGSALVFGVVFAAVIRCACGDRPDPTLLTNLSPEAQPELWTRRRGAR